MGSKLKQTLKKLFIEKLGFSSLEERLLKMLELKSAEVEILLEVFKAQNKRLLLNNNQRKRLAKLGMQLDKEDRRECLSVVKEDTLMKWYRRLVKKFSTCPKNHKGGQGILKQSTKNKITLMASKNSSWGFVRITGELKKLGIIVSYSTVRRFMLERGFNPSPLRPIKNWSKFLKRHIHVWQTDFATCPVVTVTGVRLCYMLFLVNVHTRKAVYAGSTFNPNEEWVCNKARDLTSFDGDLEEAEVLVHDNDSIFTEKFDQLFKHNDTKVIKTAYMAPNMNASVERFIRTIKEEALNDFILFSKKQLDIVVREYLEFYHKHRPHQGIDNDLIDPDPIYDSKDEEAEIIEGSFLGGHLNYYYRNAA